MISSLVAKNDLFFVSLTASAAKHRNQRGTIKMIPQKRTIVKAPPPFYIEKSNSLTAFIVLAMFLLGYNANCSRPGTRTLTLNPLIQFRNRNPHSTMHGPGETGVASFPLTTLSNIEETTLCTFLADLENITGRSKMR
jgi:hypothetical protein